MPDDPIAALVEIRERGYENGAHGAQAARLSDAAAIDVPRLLVALDAALKHHQPVQLCGTVEDFKGNVICGHSEDYDGDAHFEGDDGLWYCRGKLTVVICSTCLDEGGDGTIWPCGEYGAILTALTGKGGGGGR